MNFRGRAWGLLNWIWRVTFLCALSCALAPASTFPESLYLAGAAGVVRASLDGSSIQRLSGSSPEWTYRDVGVTSWGTVYWLFEIRNGGPICLEHIYPYARVLCVLSEALCFTLDDVGQKVYVGLSTGGIEQCDLEGGNRTTAVPAGSGFRVGGIGVDSVHGKLYWSEYRLVPGESRIRRADVVNGAVVNPETIVSGLDPAFHVCVDPHGGKIYWAERHRLQRANLDGGGVEAFVDVGTDLPTGLAFDRIVRKVYWLHISETSELGAIERANPDGTGREQLFTTGGMYYLAIGPDAPVSVEMKTWGQLKQLYR